MCWNRGTRFPANVFSDVSYLINSATLTLLLTTKDNDRRIVILLRLVLVINTLAENFTHLSWFPDREKYIRPMFRQLLSVICSAHYY